MSDKTALKRTIRVVQMGKHFLYLPFYYAKYKKFYGFLPEGVEIEKPESPVAQEERSDEAVYRTLIESADRKKSYDLAICDPTLILNQSLNKAGRQPIVLCSLVTNAAFWAVNHRTHQVRFFRDLGRYDKIIAYQPGTTSYRIAQRIHQENKKEVPLKDFIVQADVGKELQVLKRTQQPGTLALSPEIVDIDALLENNPEFAVDLELGMTPEYHNVLVSALVSRVDFVNKSENHGIIHGLLKAIQRAMIEVRFYNDEVLQFAKDTFEHGDNAKGALERAIEAQVFPVIIEVNKVQWENAVRSALADRTEDDRNNVAIQSFKEGIQPYAHFAVDAVREIFSVEQRSIPAVSRSDNSIRRYALVAVVVIILARLIGSFAAYADIIVAFSFFISVWLHDRFMLSNHPSLRAIHITAWVLLLVCSLILVNAESWFPGLSGQLDAFKVVPVFGGLITLDITIVLKAYKLN